MKIAIFSSWLPKVKIEHEELARSIARYLVENNVSIVTGGTTGIPGICIEEAHKLGAKTIGYFPNEGEHDHAEVDGNHEPGFYTEKYFIKGFTARSLAMIKGVDAAIVLNGRIGTLSEFGIAVEEGLPLAVIEGTGGITDELQRLTKLVAKEFPNNEVIFERDYKNAVDLLIKNYKNKS
ncbi:MAG: hypothetical protein KBC98_01080 [Candidatus Pacebacteria bacterium]|jgi:uncharacterized protein (TIGR00725 family)|nr:hypothetical protein [Candidatus Paceibacterota bacterium]